MFFKLKPYTYPNGTEEMWKNESCEYERYSSGVNEFSDPRILVSDKDVAKYLRQHTHWWDRLDYHFIADCAHEVFLILSGHCAAPLEKNWKFGRRYVTHWNIVRKEP